MPVSYTHLDVYKRQTKDAADIYYASLSDYPYQMYINWVPMDEGNVLDNDKKFATLLYQWHCDAFTEYSKVSDACLLYTSRCV